MKRAASLVLCLGFATLAFAKGDAGGAPIERTIPVPGRDKDVTVAINGRGVKIESVRIQNYPDREQVAKARREDPEDTIFVFWNFQISNPSDHDVKLKIDVTLIGKDGESAGRSSKSDTVKAGNVDDNIRVMMHPRIIDLADGKNAEIKVTIEPLEE